MSLNGALHVGRSALVASQAAIQVAGDNMANAATEGFHRRTVTLSSVRGEPIGNNQFVGRGVQLTSIRREVDEALQARYRDALGEEERALVANRYLDSIETLQNELTDNDLSSLLSDFFNAFSEMANNPSDNAVRAVVIQQGVSVANRVADMRRDFGNVVRQIDRQLGTTTEAVNNMLEQVSFINNQIAVAEGGAGGSEEASLRDQRDLLIDEIAGHMEVTVIERQNGAVDLLVNSVPVVLAGVNRGIEVQKQTVDGELRVSMHVLEDGTDLTIEAGTIGGLLEQRESSGVGGTIESLNLFASELVHQVNRLHSQGQGVGGFTAVTGTSIVEDPAANLNSGDADLPFRIENGSFILNTTHADTGQRTSYQINVDGDAMSLDDLVDEINMTVPNATASINAERQLVLTADAGFEMTFSEDSSGALAALGINTFFSGTGASSLTVNQVLLDDPTKLAAGLNHVPGSNGTALAIADLQDASVPELGNVSMRQYWQNAVNGLAVKSSAAQAEVESTGLVRESLHSQLQAVSGVSLDEEAISLLQYQRQFQAAARFIQVVDESLQILINLA